MLKTENNFAAKSDEDLVGLALQDSSAYGALMGRYESKLFRYVCRLAYISRDDAADIVQESFIKAYQNLNDFDRNLKFSSWIYRIVHNQTISFLRKKKPVINFSATEGEDGRGILDELQADGNLEFEIEKKHSGEALQKAISRLDKKYRSILILRYMEEKEYAEISDILKIPMGTVGTLLSRAKRSLAAQIKTA